MNNSKRTLAVFTTPGDLVQAVTAAKSSGIKVAAIYSPIPLPELEEIVPQRPSLVRWFTLLGCIAGGIFGFWLQIYSVVHWPLPVGGKPIVSISAFIVIAFELTILFGAGAALSGFLLTSRLPRFKQIYHEGCSRSDFVLMVSHDPAEYPKIKQELQDLGAREVTALNAS